MLPTRAGEYGGPVAVAEQLVQELELQGHNLDLFPSLVNVKGFKKYYDLIVKIKKSELVHIHGVWHPVTTLAAMIARIFNIPYIITPHGMLDRWALRRSKLKKIIYATLFEYKNIKSASAIHFLNAEEYVEASSFININKYFILPNGVRRDDFKYLPSRNNFFNDYDNLSGQIILLFLGRLHEKKGFDILIPALASALESNKNVHLIIAGPDEGGYKSEILNLIRINNVEGSVTFLGMVKGIKKLEAYSAADIFVLPSYQEGDSIAVKEAMASGLPVIISPACHLPEVGLLNIGEIVSMNIASCALAIKKLVDSREERKSKGLNAINYIYKNLTWDKLVVKLLVEYKKIIK